MPLRRRRFRRFRPKRKSIRKKVNKIMRAMPSLVTHCMLAFSDISISQPLLVNQVVLAGQAVTQTMDLVSLMTQIPTGIVAGTGVDNRPGSQLFFDKFDIRFRVYMPSSNVNTAIDSGIWFRALLVRVNWMPQSGATVRHPQLVELLSTKSPAVLADIDTGIQTVDELAGRGKCNFTIVREACFPIFFSAPYSHKRIHWKVKVPKGLKTTYIGNGSAITSCEQNHYVFYLIQNGKTVANNTTQYACEYNERVYYHY